MVRDPHLPRGIPVPGQQVGYVLRRVLERLDELHDDAAVLTVAGGDQVAVVCISTIEEWLRGLVSTSEAGEPL